jgi:hypothetical protein
MSLLSPGGAAYPLVKAYSTGGGRGYKKITVPQNWYDVPVTVTWLSLNSYGVAVTSSS